MSITWRSTRSRPSSRCTRACPPLRGGKQTGLLLVEAALATAVIAVGLVFISRAFTSAMRTLQVARLSDTALLLAQQKLDELELEIQRAQAVQSSQTAMFTSSREGTFAAPHAAFKWTIVARPNAQDPATLAKKPKALTSWIIVAVTTQGPAPVRVSLTTLIPRDWIPAEWGP